jgi:hypothetical protein
MNKVFREAAVAGLARGIYRGSQRRGIEAQIADYDREQAQLNDEERQDFADRIAVLEAQDATADATTGNQHGGARTGAGRPTSTPRT